MSEDRLAKGAFDVGNQLGFPKPKEWDGGGESIVTKDDLCEVVVDDFGEDPLTVANNDELTDRIGLILVRVLCTIEKDFGTIGEKLFGSESVPDAHLLAETLECWPDAL
ncbi:hypothetical protein [Flexivirga alba]|uniref:Nucleotide pyrophosphohydrolase n=1 Tax=Flexivirga alba TaxID=702742 RepID=A0ABW2AH03_9MICO